MRCYNMYTFLLRQDKTLCTFLVYMPFTKGHTDSCLTRKWRKSVNFPGTVVQVSPRLSVLGFFSETKKWTGCQSVRQINTKSQRKNLSLDLTVLKHNGSRVHVSIWTWSPWPPEKGERVVALPKGVVCMFHQSVKSLQIVVGCMFHQSVKWLN